MIVKKMTSLQAAVEQVQELFSDVESWERWMPGIRSVRVLERRPDYARVDLKMVMLGHQLQQTMEFGMKGRHFTQRQVAGRFKKYSAEWSFLPVPDGNGTTLSMEVDLDLGLVGLFVSQQTIRNALGDWFSQTAQRAEEQLRRKIPQPQPPAAGTSAAGPAQPETILQVYQSPDGLEVHIQGQKLFLRCQP